MKQLELSGVVFGVIGAFLVANGLMPLGYPVFFLSSLCLLITASKQGNKNLMVLQLVFLCANINGLAVTFL